MGVTHDRTEFTPKMTTLRDSQIHTQLVNALQAKLIHFFRSIKHVDGTFVFAAHSHGRQPIGILVVMYAKKFISVWSV